MAVIFSLLLIGLTTPFSQNYINLIIVLNFMPPEIKANEVPFTLNNNAIPSLFIKKKVPTLINCEYDLMEALKTCNVQSLKKGNHLDFKRSYDY